jgi:hypothetical protein
MGTAPPNGTKPNRGQVIRLAIEKAIIRYGPYITVFGLVFSLWQAYKSDKSREHLKAVADSVRTQFLERFPFDLPQIIDLVNRAERKLDIVADYAAYGQFSNPDGYNRYREALKNTQGRRPDVNVRVIVYNDTARIKAVDGELGTTPSDFSSLTSSQTWIDYFRFYRGREKPTTLEAFKKMLTDEEESCLRQLHDKGIIPDRLQGPFPMFFWLRDDIEAIFVFYSFDRTNPLKERQAVAFRTFDTNLIEMMKAINTKLSPNPPTNTGK